MRSNRRRRKTDIELRICTQCRWRRCWTGGPIAISNTTGYARSRCTTYMTTTSWFVSKLNRFRLRWRCNWICRSLNYRRSRRTLQSEFCLLQHTKENITLGKRWLTLLSRRRRTSSIGSIFWQFACSTIRRLVLPKRLCGKRQFSFVQWPYWRHKWSSLQPPDLPKHLPWRKSLHILIYGKICLATKNK